MSYLLDSNTVIAGFNRRPEVVARLNRLRPEEVVLCSPVLAELELGARLSARSQENLDKLDNLIAETDFAPFDLEAARLFGRLKAQLRRRGVRINDFDLAIAAIAIRFGFTLVSDDHVFHQGYFVDLAVEDWLHRP